MIFSIVQLQIVVVLKRMREKKLATWRMLSQRRMRTQPSLKSRIVYITTPYKLLLSRSKSLTNMAGPHLLHILQM